MNGVVRKNRCSYGYGELKDLILTHVPDFCWQTSFEILTMLEQVDEDLGWDNLRVRLHQLHKDGLIERRSYTKSRPHGSEWKKRYSEPSA